MAPLIVLTQGGGIDLTSACRAPAAGHWPNTRPMSPLEDLVGLEPRLHCTRYRSPSTLWLCYLLAHDGYDRLQTPLGEGPAIVEIK